MHSTFGQNNVRYLSTVKWIMKKIESTSSVSDETHEMTFTSYSEQNITTFCECGGSPRTSISRCVQELQITTNTFNEFLLKIWISLRTKSNRLINCCQHTTHRKRSPIESLNNRSDCRFFEQNNFYWWGTLLSFGFRESTNYSWESIAPETCTLIDVHCTLEKSIESRQVMQ